MYRVPLSFAGFLTIGLSLAPAAPSESLEIHGHRGARGLLPENTLAGFARALSIGVTALELDVVMTADEVLVVCHDPVLNPSIARGAGGEWLTAPTPLVGELTYAELAKFDVGRIDPSSKYARRFSTQTPRDGARIPTLAAVLDLVTRAENDKIRFSIETKLRPDRPEHTPAPEVLADALIQIVRNRGLAQRVTIQSFDWRTLRHVQSVAPGLETTYLSAERRWLNNIERGVPGPSPWTAGFDVDEFGGSVPRLVKAAGASAWAPYHRDLDPGGLEQAHRLGLRVVVWTVNDPGDMERLIDMGVDGIITDYPDRLREVAAQRGLEIPRPTPISP